MVLFSTSFQACCKTNTRASSAENEQRALNIPLCAVNVVREQPLQFNDLIVFFCAVISSCSAEEKLCNIVFLSDKLRHKTLKEQMSSEIAAFKEQTYTYTYETALSIAVTRPLLLTAQTGGKKPLTYVACADDSVCY